MSLLGIDSANFKPMQGASTSLQQWLFSTSYTLDEKGENILLTICLFKLGCLTEYKYNKYEI
jgi:hypothetical protein